MWVRTQCHRASYRGLKRWDRLSKTRSGQAGDADHTLLGAPHRTPKGDSTTPDCKLLLSPALYCLPEAPFSWVTRVPQEQRYIEKVAGRGAEKSGQSELNTRACSKCEQGGRWLSRGSVEGPQSWLAATHSALPQSLDATSQGDRSYRKSSMPSFSSADWC